jgi:hypothetical protein
MGAPLGIVICNYALQMHNYVNNNPSLSLGNRHNHSLPLRYIGPSDSPGDRGIPTAWADFY